MLSYLVKRVMALVPVSLGVILLVSALAHVVPGDPVDAILGDLASAEEKSKLRQELHLDEPFLKQMTGYIWRVLHADLGHSLLSRRAVIDMILERFPATLSLAITAVAVALLFSIPLGITAAVFAGGVVDYLAMGFAMLGIAMPGFWLASILILIFSLRLDWLPVSGRGDLTSYVLPSLTMGVALAAILTRMTRNSMLDVFKEDYIRTARAKGISEFWVYSKHAFRNAALPLVTIVGLQFGVVLTGAVITETIFDWPGLGSMMLDGVRGRDYPVIQACVLVFSMTYLLVNFLTDVLYCAVDPRIGLGD